MLLPLSLRREGVTIAGGGGCGVIAIIVFECEQRGYDVAAIAIAIVVEGGAAVVLLVCLGLWSCCYCCVVVMLKRRGRLHGYNEYMYFTMRVNYHRW